MIQPTAIDRHSLWEQHRCSVCGEHFESRTKLFKHIRDEGHATPLSRGTPALSKSKGKKGK